MRFHIPQDFHVHPKEGLVPAEDFSHMLDDHFSKYQNLVGCLLKGVVIAITDDHVVVDVGLKSEGIVPLAEFPAPSLKDGSLEPSVAVGDTIDVFVERFEDRHGFVQLSYERALKEAEWLRLSQLGKEEIIYGVIEARLRTGYRVILERGGLVAYLHRNQLDVRPTNVEALMGSRQGFHIEFIDRTQNIIRVSRRSVVIAENAKMRPKILENLHTNKVLKGTVKSLLDYGAFVDLGGIDGLLHISEISWKNLKHPSDILQPGQSIDVMVIRVDSAGKRISLSARRLQSGPWDAPDFAQRYTRGTVHDGVVTKVSDNGVFVRTEEGVEGFVQKRDLTWEKGANFHPSQYVKEDEALKVMVLTMNRDDYALSLGIKQCLKNPFEKYAEQHQAGDVVEGTVRNVTSMGLRVQLGAGGFESMVEKSYLSWNTPSEVALRSFQTGDKVSLKILDIESDNGRILLSLKHASQDVNHTVLGSLDKGMHVLCTVDALHAWGASVHFTHEGVEVPSFVRRDSLPQDALDTGKTFDTKVLFIHTRSGTVDLSAKAFEADEKQRFIEEYRPSATGHMLGDILSGISGLVQEIEENKKSTTSSSDTKPSETSSAPEAASDVSTASEAVNTQTAEGDTAKDEDKPSSHSTV